MTYDIKKRELLEKMLPLVNSQYWSYFEDYLRYLIEEDRFCLENASDFEKVNKFQGRISRCRDLLELQKTMDNMKKSAQ